MLRPDSSGGILNFMMGDRPEEALEAHKEQSNRTPKNTHLINLSPANEISHPHSGGAIMRREGNILSSETKVDILSEIPTMEISYS